MVPAHPASPGSPLRARLVRAASLAVACAVAVVLVQVAPKGSAHADSGPQQQGRNCVLDTTASPSALTCYTTLKAALKSTVGHPVTMPTQGGFLDKQGLDDVLRGATPDRIVLETLFDPSKGGSDATRGRGGGADGTWRSLTVVGHDCVDGRTTLIPALYRYGFNDVTSSLQTYRSSCAAYHYRDDHQWASTSLSQVGLLQGCGNSWIEETWTVDGLGLVDPGRGWTDTISSLEYRAATDSVSTPDIPFVGCDLSS